MTPDELKKTDAVRCVLIIQSLFYTTGRIGKNEYLSLSDIQREMTIRITEEEITELITTYILPTGTFATYYDKNDSFLGYSFAL